MGGGGLHLITSSCRGDRRQEEPVVFLQCSSVANTKFYPPAGLSLIFLPDLLSSLHSAQCSLKVPTIVTTNLNINVEIPGLNMNIIVRIFVYYIYM